MLLFRLRASGIRKLTSVYDGYRGYSDGGNNRVKSINEIPGPSGLPVVGPLLHFLPGGILYNKTGMALTDALYSTYGPIVKLDPILGRPKMIFLFDPEACAHVLRSENTMPSRPGFESLEYFKRVYAKHKFKDITGLLTDQGENWKNFRSKVNPVLMQPKVAKLYDTAIDEVALDMIQRMKSLRNSDNMIKDLGNEMNKWALESVAVVALGGRLGCLAPDLPSDSRVRKLILLVHEIFELNEKLDFRPSLWRYFPTKNFKRAMKVYDDQLEISKYCIKKAIKDLKSNVETEHEKSVLEKLYEIDEDVAVIMATDMLFAGVDTAANTILATLYLLATNPEKQEKLRKEIISGDDKRTYLKACIKESMRILPVVAGNMRQTTKDIELHGYAIPKNTNIVFAHQ